MKIENTWRYQEQTEEAPALHRSPQRTHAGSEARKLHNIGKRIITILRSGEDHLDPANDDDVGSVPPPVESAKWLLACG